MDDNLLQPTHDELAAQLAFLKRMDAKHGCGSWPSARINLSDVQDGHAMRELCGYRGPVRRQSFSGVRS